MPAISFDDLVPVILAGGSGTRLWPVSRSAFPKHLVELTGERSLLQITAARLGRLAADGRTVTVSAAAQAVLVRRQFDEQDARLNDHLLLEPSPRNTAAAIALAALHVEQLWGRDSVLFVCPSDHLVLAEEALFEAVARGIAAARQGLLVTFGIDPARPETGFGYIAEGAPLDGLPGVHAVARFVEKPVREKAEEMLAAGGHFWNSGMFLMRAGAVLDELERYEPAILAATRKAFEGRDDKGRIAPEAYAAIKSMPIDKAVMERSDKVAVVPCDPRWSDVGSWQALWEIMARDDNGNVVRGDVILADSSNNLVKAEHRLVALAGVRDLAVIETADAVLVADLSRSEPIKEVVGQLVAGSRKEADIHARELRPWGAFTILSERPGCMVREVVVEPGAALTSQRHRTRDEHWTVVEGTALVELDGERHEIAAGQSITVAHAVRHRLSNPGAGRLRLIEVQTGEHLGEADVERFSD